jgi:hypothetical protein
MRLPVIAANVLLVMMVRKIELAPWFLQAMSAAAVVLVPGMVAQLPCRS